MRGITVDKKGKTILLFAVCFCIGLGSTAIFKPEMLPRQPAAIESQSSPEQDISVAASEVSPSIVGISNYQRSAGVVDQRSPESTGSGVIVDGQGHIVTNNHVIKGAERIVVTLADGNEEEAQLVGSDARTDLALIKVKVDRHVTPISFGDSDRLVVGQQVLAIGNPLGLRFARSVTAGVISGLNRLLTTEEGFPFRLIQTDAAINPGNSGGALVSLDGKLIGINTIKISAEGFEGIGFAIPSNQVQSVINDLKQYGRVIRPVMGIKILGEVSLDQARYHQLPRDCGVVVEPVAGGPAAKAGIKDLDIVCKIDGQEVATSLELMERIAMKESGDNVKVEVIRLPLAGDGKPLVKTVSVALGK